MSATEHIRLNEARLILGVAHNTMLRIFKRRNIELINDTLDTRRKYVRRSDIERLKREAEVIRGDEEQPELYLKDVRETEAA